MIGNEDLDILLFKVSQTKFDFAESQGGSIHLLTVQFWEDDITSN